MTTRRTESRRGRQAEAARNDRLVLDAAREVFTTQGFDAPVSAVADHAGVGIGSLYRRYGSKTELLQKLCVLAMDQVVESAETALADPDPWTALADHIQRCVAFGSGALAPIAGTIETTAEMWAANTRVRKTVDQLVDRAHTAGVLRADATALDISHLIELFSRRGHLPQTEDERNNRDRLVAIALHGLRPGDTPLPGSPPARSTYESPWRAP